MFLENYFQDTKKDCEKVGATVSEQTGFMTGEGTKIKRTILASKIPNSSQEKERAFFGRF